MEIDQNSTTSFLSEQLMPSNRLVMMNRSLIFVAYPELITKVEKYIANLSIQPDIFIDLCQFAPYA